MESMNIRKYQKDDRQKLIDLWSIVFPEDPPHNSPLIVIEAKLSVDDLIFIVEHENNIVGACIAGYDGHRGWLYAVAVIKKYRRKGVGAKLINYAMASLKELGCVKVNLQIRSTNKQVEDFYKSLGFATEDRLSMGAFIS